LRQTPQVPASAGFFIGFSKTTLAVDGGQSGEVNTGSTGLDHFTLSLTTTQTNDVIVVVVQGADSGGTGFTITGSGLTFRQRGSTLDVGGNLFAVFWAKATSTFSGNITVTVNSWAGFGFSSAIGWAISGANTSSLFDANVSLPATTSTTAAASGTTSNANDFVFAAYQDGLGTAGAGWAQILNGTGDFSVEYQVVSSAGSYTGNLSPNNNTLVGVTDAVVAWSGAGGGSVLFRSL
jgi:hypothetical protein